MSFLSDLQGKQLFLVGIKGTGMATLACQLVRFGVNVTGSDVPEVFATEAVLKAANITWFETFSAEVMPADCTMLILSAAYTSANLQVSRAIQNKILVFSYPQFVAH
ncbi:MAG: Mur ligase domain-containing protein, partial [Sphaerochaetaceae bacterium]|nr:Mur ligase domain-containing protein [Sphaerochaetaceae bacterium]